MSKFNIRKAVRKLGYKFATSIRCLKDLWGRFMSFLHDKLTQYLISAKTFNITVISIEGEPFKYLALACASLSLLIVVCHHYGVNPEWLVNAIIRVINALHQQK